MRVIDKKIIDRTFGPLDIIIHRVQGGICLRAETMSWQTYVMGALFGLEVMVVVKHPEWLDSLIARRDNAVTPDGYTTPRRSFDFTWGERKPRVDVEPERVSVGPINVTFPEEFVAVMKRLAGEEN